MRLFSLSPSMMGEPSTSMSKNTLDERLGFFDFFAAATASSVSEMASARKSFILVAEVM